MSAMLAGLRLARHVREARRTLHLARFEAALSYPIPLKLIAPIGKSVISNSLVAINFGNPGKAYLASLSIRSALPTPDTGGGMSDAQDLRKRFGLLVTGHRKKKRMTQEALATAAGLSPDMVGRIEAGKTGARFPSIERLAAALEVDPAELFSPDSNGTARTPAMSMLLARLSTMNDRDVVWVSRLLDAALKPRG